MKTGAYAVLAPKASENIFFLDDNTRNGNKFLIIYNSMNGIEKPPDGRLSASERSLTGSVRGIAGIALVQIPPEKIANCRAGDTGQQYAAIVSDQAGKAQDANRNHA